MKMPAQLQDAFKFQAKACDQLGSPFMHQLCNLLAARAWPNTRLRDVYFSWQGDIGPSAQSLPLRLAGGLHALALQGDVLADAYPPHAHDDQSLWEAVQTALTDHDAFLCDWVKSPPQTNEVRRAAVLIALGAALADRYDCHMRVSELGASAGLNLMWDRFALDIGSNQFGDTASDVRLSPEWTGPLPPATKSPTVAERRGVDLNPLNPADPNDQLRLQAYLWPDQPDRIARTKAAIDLAQAAVDQSDAIDWLVQRLSHETGQLHLIYSTIAWQYFPQEAQQRGQSMIEAAGAIATDDTPLAWFGMEQDGKAEGAALTLRLWPGDKTINLGRMDFHGRWINWNGM